MEDCKRISQLSSLIGVPVTPYTMPSFEEAVKMEGAWGVRIKTPDQIKKLSQKYLGRMASGLFELLGIIDYKMNQFQDAEKKEELEHIRLISDYINRQYEVCSMLQPTLD